jgi:hypothetical protein
MSVLTVILCTNSISIFLNCSSQQAVTVVYKQFFNTEQYVNILENSNIFIQRWATFREEFKIRVFHPLDMPGTQRKSSSTDLNIMIKEYV